MVWHIYNEQMANTREDGEYDTYTMCYAHTMRLTSPKLHEGLTNETPNSSNANPI